MIVAGIDEAGYGPLLGPLIVGCCAFEVEHGGAEGDAASASDGKAGTECEGPPCLRKRLRKHVSRNRTKNGKKIHVNDSKVVYAPAAGLKELERSILALLATCGDWPRDLHALLDRTAEGAVDEL